MEMNLTAQDLIDAMCEDNGPQTKEILQHCLEEAVSRMQQEIWTNGSMRVKCLEERCERLQEEVNSLRSQNRLYVFQEKMRDHGIVRIYATPKAKDHKIQCIKNIRDWAGLGLKDAKDAVESMIDRSSHCVEVPKVMNIHDDLLTAIFRFEVIE